MAGILADRSSEEAMTVCRNNDIALFDLVVVNVQAGEGQNSAIGIQGQLQVGPLSLIRLAATNYEQVKVVSAPCQYVEVLKSFDATEEEQIMLHRRLVREAWNLAANFDMEIASHFEETDSRGLPGVLRSEHRLVSNLRYGENPHQEAALYAHHSLPGPCVAGARVGFNLALEFAAPGAVIVKHAMPVSAAIGLSIAESIQKAFDAAWASRIGAAVACNGVIDADAARALLKPGRKIDLVIASDFSPEAIEVLHAGAKEDGALRLLKAGNTHQPAGTGKHRRIGLHHVSGGVLAQSIDDGVYGSGGFHVVTKREATDQEMIDLEFACLVAKHARSHAAVLAKNGATAAVATVQTSRVEAAHIALERAGSRAQGAVMASDSTLSLAELALLIEGGVRAFIQTGAPEAEDAALIAACNERDVAMIITKMRHYRHV
jgi:phosphoribosylaminoimidazolecarboxamide formyltransferase/IMP cyclohydrolase